MIPHTHQEQKDFILTHKKAVAKLKYNYPTKENFNEVHELHEKLMKYIDIKMYNKYAINICRFGKLETQERCEKVFKQTPRHYSVHGNCCQTCSNFFSWNARSN